MTYTLRYQSLIDKENLVVPCPDKQVTAIRRESYRWCNTPIDYEYNFLPNRYVDELKGKKRRKLPGDEACCEYCAVSFFDSLVNAKEKYMGFPERIREMLGYTHIAYGAGALHMTNDTSIFY
jgi:hypothetical protein